MKVKRSWNALTMKNLKKVPSRRVDLKIYLTIFLYFIPEVYAENPIWTNYTNTDKVFAILDGSTHIWVGTDGGLVRINKSTEEVKCYTRANSGMPGHHITALSIDSADHLWVGSYRSGIGMLEGDSFITHNAQNSGLPYDGWNNALAIHPNENILIGSSRSLVIYDGATWDHIPTGNPIMSDLSINDIEINSAGIAWIGASWGLGRYDGEELLEGFADIHSEIYSIAIDTHQALWLGTNGQGLIKYTSTGTTTFDTTNSDIPGNIVYSMDHDVEGNLWLGTENGLAKYKGTNWTVYNTTNSGLLENVVFAVEVDDNGIIWIGLWHHGLMKFDGSLWNKIDISNSGLPSNSVSAMEVDRDSYALWFGTGTTTGLVRRQNTLWERFDGGAGIPNTNVHAIEIDATGHLWVGAGFGPSLLEYDGSDWYVHDAEAGLPGYDSVTDLYLDEYGNLWVGTAYSGLFKGSGTDWINYNTQNSQLTSNAITSIVSDRRGNMWVSMKPYVSGERGGVARFDSENWTIHNTENSGLPFDNVGNLVFDDRDILWMSTHDQSVSGIEYGGGLTKYESGVWTTFNIYNSDLTSNTIFDLTLDDQQNLWIGTGWGGLVKLDSDNNWTIYDKSNSGIASNLIAEVQVDWNGNKWIGHYFSGLSVFNENGIVTSTDRQSTILPAEVVLLQSYPNPFNPSTTIGYDLPEQLKVNLTIYDVIGRKVATLQDSEQEAGHYEVTWDGSDNLGNQLSTGIYLARFQAGEFSETIKLMYLK